MSKILIVEDDNNIAKAMEILLAEEGHAIHIVGNCDAALLLMKNKQFDLILQDIMLPGMPAKDFVEKLKMDKKFSKIKIVYVTAMSYIGMGEGTAKLVEPFSLRFAEINKAFAVGILQKPFTKEKLLGVVNKALADKKKDIIL